MENLKPFVSVIMPALNEEKTVVASIDDVLSAFKEVDVKGEVIVVNDGSSDSTPFLIQDKAREVPGTITMIDHPVRRGIGTSFWDGVDKARGDIICMFPADKENDPREALRYIKLFEDVDIVIPFIFNRNVRSLSRNVLSRIYLLIINNSFFTSLNYANGNTMFRKTLLKEIRHRCSGFFFQTDILIRLIKRGYLFAEIPCKLKKREKGKSKAVGWGSLAEVIKGYTNLLADVYLKRTEQNKGFVPDSAAFKRYKEMEHETADT
jgi:glycosyltransferase involved in cell wall biosynthesis